MSIDFFSKINRIAELTVLEYQSDWPSGIAVLEKYKGYCIGKLSIEFTTNNAKAYYAVLNFLRVTRFDHLRIRVAGMSEAQLVSILKAIPKQIISLDISSNGITTASLRASQQALQQYKNLEELDLSFNELDEQAKTTLLAMSSSLKNATLNVFHNDFDWAYIYYTPCGNQHLIHCPIYRNHA